VNGKTGNPLSFNLYSYGLGNPLKYYDPNGRMAKLPDVPYPTLEIIDFFRGSPFANYSLEDLLSELKSDEAVEKANQQQYKEGDVIYRVNPNDPSSEDVARIDGRDSQGRLLVMGYDKKTGFAKLVPLGSEEDMFGNFIIKGVWTPKGAFVQSWESGTEEFKKKYQGQILYPGTMTGRERGKYKEWECHELTTNVTYLKFYIDLRTIISASPMNITFYKEKMNIK
jgi:hypothetical protein